jgi:prephenate dehydrogenase
MFSAVVRLLDRGFVETLVDARYQHHDHAMAYSNALTNYLSGRIRAAIAERDSAQ